eukprot:CAMPEP_0116846072 /NCGR_PEP_ID=MMETSP0418-20121206/13633_1 /TAXON_ID=1158023 /ORGANISM="Astrosyne radiata, Strain 13vi08-1A" /LENGTH=628 /DNA_ID=CAMNT_0004477281 /DNA_START=35 /DNA_END=1922 /DNA_ORIENTATION=+
MITNIDQPPPPLDSEGEIDISSLGLGKPEVQQPVFHSSVQEKVQSRIRKTLESLPKESQLFDEELSCFRALSRYKWEDLDIGDQLGEGGFGTVHQVTHPDQQDSAPALAVKFLRPNITEDIRILQGSIDLAVEGHFLSVLQHENLVKLHAVSADNDGCSFLVLDRLDGTLSVQMEKWIEQEAQVARRYRKGSSQLEQHHRYLLNGRLKVAKDIAKALKYLHENHIVYRDLKPSNIGFDSNGVTKLFDFGLAKEMKNPVQNGKFKMTGETGSGVYMAPEVAKHWAYNGSVDTYSFGILLWEMASLKNAFAEYSPEDVKKVVLQGDVHPRMDASWPAELKTLIEKCWSYFPQNRPSWDVVLDSLRVLIEDCDIDIQSDSQRGSSGAFSLRLGSGRKRQDRLDELLSKPMASQRSKDQAKTKNRHRRTQSAPSAYGDLIGDVPELSNRDEKKAHRRNQSGSGGISSFLNRDEPTKGHRRNRSSSSGGSGEIAGLPTRDGPAGKGHRRIRSGSGGGSGEILGFFNRDDSTRKGHRRNRSGSSGGSGEIAGLPNESLRKSNHRRNRSNTGLPPVPPAGLPPVSPATTISPSQSGEEPIQKATEGSGVAQDWQRCLELENADQHKRIIRMPSPS